MRQDIYFFTWMILVSRNNQSIIKFSLLSPRNENWNLLVEIKERKNLLV